MIYEHRHSLSNKTEDDDETLDDRDRYRDLLRDTPPKVIRKLVRKYWFDFALFDYDHKMLLEIAEEKEREQEAKLRALL